MTDNEKRAHDLAVSTISVLFADWLKSNDLPVGITDSFPNYEKYKKFYQGYLEVFEKDFKASE